MFDVTSRQSYKNVPRWYEEVRAACPNIPVVLLGNKVDSLERTVKAVQITFHHTKGIQ